MSWLLTAGWICLGIYWLLYFASLNEKHSIWRCLVMPMALGADLAFLIAYWATR